MIFERKPSDYNLKNHFYATVWQNCELEIVAKNIVSILKADGDEFKPFTLEYYTKQCGHTVTRNEECFVEDLCEKGYLDLENGEYSVNLRFIGVIEAFRKKKRRKNGNKK